MKWLIGICFIYWVNLGITQTLLNGDFENWNLGNKNPIFWEEFTLNHKKMCGSSRDAHSGNYSVMLSNEVYDSDGDGINDNVSTGQLWYSVNGNWKMNFQFEDNLIPDSIVGWMKVLKVSKEPGVGIVGLNILAEVENYSNRVFNTLCNYQVKNFDLEWKRFSIPILKQDVIEEYDSLFFLIQCGTEKDLVVLIDDIEFIYNSLSTDKSDNHYKIITNQENNTISIEFELASEVLIYDELGKLVFSVTGSKNESKITSVLPPGVYFVGNKNNSKLQRCLILDN